MRITQEIRRVGLVGQGDTGCCAGTCEHAKEESDNVVCPLAFQERTAPAASDKVRDVQSIRSEHIVPTFLNITRLYRGSLQRKDSTQLSGR